MKRLFIVFALLFCVLSIPVVMVSAEEVEVIAEVSAWEKFVQNYLSAEKVAMYLSWAAYIGTILGLAANIKKLKATNNLTLKNVSDSVQELIKTVVGEEVKNRFNEFIEPVNNVLNKLTDTLKGFSKVLALSQENTPESRVAILQVIEELGTAGHDLVENAKEVIVKEVELTKEHKELIETKLDDIIKEYDGTSI